MSDETIVDKLAEEDGPNDAEASEVPSELGAIADSAQGVAVESDAMGLVERSEVVEESQSFTSPEEGSSEVGEEGGAEENAAFALYVADNSNSTCTKRKVFKRRLQRACVKAFYS